MAEPITELLWAAEHGQAGAWEQVLRIVYDELHRLAEQQLAGDGVGRQHQPTTLVHEAYLRLVGADESVHWNSRRHFFAAAANAMRRICVDYARMNSCEKRGGGRVLSLADPEVAAWIKGRSGTQGPGPQRERGCVDNAVSEEASAPDAVLVDFAALDEALKRLEVVAPREAEVVNLRYFAGLTREQIGEALEISPRTVDNEWRHAKAWLHRELTR